MMKSKIKSYGSTLSRWLSNPYVPFALLFLVFLFIHSFATMCHDDIWFSTCLSSYPSDGGMVGFLQSLLAFTQDRYMTWSSRSIIEAVQIVLTLSPMWIFEILDSLLFTSIAVVITKLFFKDHPQKYCIGILVSLLLLIYPFMEMTETGWIATTANYAFPFALGLIAIYGVKKIIIDNEKVSVFGYIGYTMALLYGANQEQMCVALLLTLSCFAIYAIVSHKAKNKYVFVQLALVLLMLLYILTCPGDDARSVSETAARFPEYASFGLLTKLMLGFSVTINQLMIRGNLVFLAFSVLLASLIFIKTKKILPRLAAMIPPVYLIGMQAVHYAANNGSQKANNLLANFSELGIIGKYNYQSITPYLWTAAMVLVLVCVVYGCFIVFYGEIDKGWIATGILAVGFITQFMLGFSPTVWASLNRTAFILNMSLVVCGAYLLQNWKFENQTATNSLRAFLAGGALYQVAVTVLLFMT